jgi:hypothetical protein
MSNRSLHLIAGAALIGLLLVTGGMVTTMAWMSNGLQGDHQPGLYGPGGMMGGYQQDPLQQGPPITGLTQLAIRNFTYQPINLQVAAGTTVTWTNQDSVPHSVTFRNGMKDSGLFGQGKSFSYTFTSPETFYYDCTVHPSMVAVVTVTEER